MSSNGMDRHELPSSVYDWGNRCGAEASHVLDSSLEFLSGNCFSPVSLICSPLGLMWYLVRLTSVATAWH